MSSPVKLVLWRGAASNLLIALGLGSLACSIPNNRAFKLEVPYRAQTQFNYCVPASILMWRLWNRLPEISQDEIWQVLGGPPCTANQIPFGLTRFTLTFDTYLDAVLSPTRTQRDHLVARQITSIGEGWTPVIVVVRPSKNHVGVLTGGKYHADPTLMLNVWDYVYMHDPDPSFGASYFFSAAFWLSEFCLEFDSHCAQVVSSGAVNNWFQKYQAFGPSVYVYGDDGQGTPDQQTP